jgi:hypothetical protein
MNNDSMDFKKYADSFHARNKGGYYHVRHLATVENPDLVCVELDIGWPGCGQTSYPDAFLAMTHSEATTLAAALLDAVALAKDAA